MLHLNKDIEPVYRSVKLSDYVLMWPFSIAIDNSKLYFVNKSEKLTTYNLIYLSESERFAVVRHPDELFKIIYIRWGTDNEIVEYFLPSLTDKAENGLINSYGFIHLLHRNGPVKLNINNIDQYFDTSFYQLDESDPIIKIYDRNFGITCIGDIVSEFKRL